MKQLLFGVSISMMLPFTACDDNKADETENSMNTIEVTTDNVNDGPYYFNFLEGARNSTSWHLSYNNLDAGGGNYMPSFSLSNAVMLSINNSLKFEDITEIPSTDLFGLSDGKLSYGGDSAVLVYNMQLHTISVSDNNYIIYDTISKKIFKLHFDEYSAGVVIFRFAELNTN